ncbi:MAG TPA: TIGR04282 family arsenosugar biosynthesis glycosyltransferase [Nevskiales bacterium]|nr:TIGR04282 family arsenosugar biosynthesis glycosyltransferase [Nevskiales bacterium]
MRPVRVLVFAKAPQPGVVKTRLIPALGPEGAARLAQRMLTHTVQQALASAVGDVVLCTSPAPTHPAWQDALPAALAQQLCWVDQGAGDLGERLWRMAEHHAAAGHALLFIGTDCPALDAAALHAVVQGLHTHDAVLVPSTDGGYVALGVREPHPRLFADMPWSTPEVAAVTRARMAALGWHWAEAPALTDIDEPEHLAALPAAWQEAA